MILYQLSLPTAPTTLPLMPSQANDDTPLSLPALIKALSSTGGLSMIKSMATAKIL